MLRGRPGAFNEPLGYPGALNQVFYCTLKARPPIARGADCRVGESGGPSNLIRMAPFCVPVVMRVTEACTDSPFASRRGTNKGCPLGLDRSPRGEARPGLSG